MFATGMRPLPRPRWRDKPKAKGPVAVGFSETPAYEGRGITATVKV